MMRFGAGWGLLLFSNQIKQSVFTRTDKCIVYISAKLSKLFAYIYIYKPNLLYT